MTKIKGILPLALGLFVAACAAPPPHTGLAPGSSFRHCPECPEMIVVPPGSFMMGASTDEAERTNVITRSHVNAEQPRHRVTIDHTFALGKFKVTRADFAAFVRDTGYSDIESCYRREHGRLALAMGKDWRDPGFPQTDRDPVVCVNWNDARSYVFWLSRKTGKRYRLVSEAEWEYVARTGAGPVVDGGAPPNRFGVRDMFGRIGEWLNDCWHDSYDGAPKDGSAWNAPGRCAHRVVRGAARNDGASRFRPSERGRFEPFHRSVDIGFRVAASLD